MEQVPPWLAALISAAVGGLVALAARWLDRRRGVPAEVDAAIDSHVAFVVETLKTRIDQLETARTECERRLSEGARQLAEELNRGDRLERQVNRLLLQLENGS